MQSLVLVRKVAFCQLAQQLTDEANILKAGAPIVQRDI